MNRDILLNYAAAHPEHGYTQGMSDLLAPLLIEIQNEVDTYWCFVGLMLRTIFVSSPTDIDMDKQLVFSFHFCTVLYSVILIINYSLNSILQQLDLCVC